MTTTRILAASLFFALAAALPAQEALVRAAESIIRRNDQNDDDRVEFREFRDQDQAAFKALDKNGDGVLSVGDWLQKARSTAEETRRFLAERESLRYSGFQVVPRFDRDRNGALDDEEAALLLLVIMDADEDRVLTAAEIRRGKPPPGTGLAAGWFVKDGKLLDANADGVITLAEMRVPDVVRRAVDRNHDGRIAIEEIARGEVGLIGGYVPRFQEASATVLRLGKLDKANWPGDPDAFGRIDQDRDGAISLAEFDRYARALKTILAACPDFVTRFDLDGDGRVGRAEFAGTDAMFARMDRNQDGAVSAADR